MAFTSAPVTQTYRPIKIKFDGTPLYRYGSISTYRDISIINFFYDRVSQENKTREIALKKRPGFISTGYSLSKNSASDPLRGFFYDVDQNALYWAVNNKVYSVSPDSGSSIRTVTTLVGSSGYVGFCSYLKGDGTRFVIFSDGTDLWIDNYAAISCSKVTAPDLPTPHLPYPIYLDGYIFLAKNGDLYNSNVDDPTAWTAGDFISAEMGSDYITRIAKAKNYIIVFGYNTTEYFWDASIASGSPLSRNDSPFRNIGYVTGFSMAGDKLYFVGQDEKENISVYEVDGFKINPISNEVVDRTLQTVNSSDNSKSNVYLNRDGYIISADGHTFYVLVTSQTTWVYDVDEKLWYEWRDSLDAPLNIEATWCMFAGGQYVAMSNQATIGQFSPSIYQDFTMNFKCSYTTERIDAETQNNKFCSRATLKSDKYSNTGTSNLNLFWSDDDWASIQGPGIINLFNDLSCTYQLGKFRNRSFRLEYSDNYPLRMTGLELDINVGNS